MVKDKVILPYVPLVERVARRLIKVFVAGAIASILVVPPMVGFDRTSLEMYALAIFHGAVAGGLSALDKYLSEQN